MLSAQGLVPETGSHCTFLMVFCLPAIVLGMATQSARLWISVSLSDLRILSIQRLTVGPLQVKDLDMPGTVQGLALGTEEGFFQVGIAAPETISVGLHTLDPVSGVEADNKSPWWSWSQHGPPSRKASSAASFA